MLLPSSGRPVEMNVVQRGEKIVLQFNQDVAEVVFGMQDAAELAHALASIVQEMVRKNHSN